MISRELKLPCSRKAELLLALAVVRAPKSVVSIAHCVANDSERSTVRLARSITSLPDALASSLASKTLEEIGITWKPELIKTDKEQLYTRVRKIMKKVSNR